MCDELESTNDPACLRYMLSNNSSNNSIYLECLLSTRVCVCASAQNAKSRLPSLVSKLSMFSHELCWFTHEKTSPSMHQDTIDNPSYIASSLPVFCAASSASARLVQAAQLRFKTTSCQQRQNAYGSFQNL